jgi:hypothetical protein
VVLLARTLATKGKLGNLVSSSSLHNTIIAIGGLAHKITNEG